MYYPKVGGKIEVKQVKQVKHVKLDEVSGATDRMPFTGRGQWSVGVRSRYQNSPFQVVIRNPILTDHDVGSEQALVSLSRTSS